MQESDQGNMQAAARQIYTEAAQLLVRDKKSPQEVKAYLHEKGLDDETADMVIKNVLDTGNTVKTEKAKRDMIIGALFLFGGIAVTVYTYTAASNGGGRYFLAYGPIIYGGYRFFRGLLNRG